VDNCGKGAKNVDNSFLAPFSGESVQIKKLLFKAIILQTVAVFISFLDDH